MDCIQQARQLLQSKDYGQAFSLLLLTGKSFPHLLDGIKDEFLFCTQQWFQQLVYLGHVKETIDCMETSLDVFDNHRAEILHLTGRILFDQRYDYEAAGLLTAALQISHTNFDIREDFDEIVNLLVSRWHFRMLNDKTRNEIFFMSLKKAISEGYYVVLDIGSGTGLLSLFAAYCGAREIYSCETSEIMYDISVDVVKESRLEKQIHSMNKMSTDIEMGKDVKDRVPLVVTEIFDCGLLGEGVIPTLLHAWKKLLVPQNRNETVHNALERTLSGKVIPCGARVFVVAVECLELRTHKRTDDIICGLNLGNVALIGNKDPGDVKEQPYTTERMNRIKNGYKALSEPLKIWEFDFNNPEHLESQVGKTCVFDIPVINGGILDAFVVWFELQLDEDLSLSTSTESNTCWQQAIYNAEFLCGCHCEKDIEVISGSITNLQSTCTPEFLDIRVARITRDKKHQATAVAKEIEVCPSNNTKDGETALLGNNSGFSFTCCKCCKISPTDDAADRVGMLQKLSISCKCCDVTDFDGHSKDDDKEKAPEDRTASSATGTHCQCQIMFALATDRRTVARINDTGYSLCYIKALEEVINCWKSGTASEDELHVVCLNGSLSLIPLLSAKSNNMKVTVLTNKEEEEGFYQSVAEGNDIPTRRLDIQYTSLPEFATTGIKFDAAVYEFIEPSGLIKQQAIEDIILLRGCLLKDDGKMLPEGFAVHGMCISSATLREETSVIGDDVTLGFKIAEFMNKYQVSTHPDIDLSVLPHTGLSEEFELLNVDFETAIDEEFVLPDGTRLLEVKDITNRCLQQRHRKVKISRTGSLTAVVYWFILYLSDNITLSTGPDLEWVYVLLSVAADDKGRIGVTHWHQAAVVFKDEIPVVRDQELSLDVTLNRSTVHIDFASR